MAFFKRIFLFMAVNALVVVTISLVLNILGVQPYLTQRGLDYNSLMAFCLVWGMGGAFISLLLSKVMAKWMMGVQIVDPNTRDPGLQSLVQTVHNLARGAGLGRMPEVGIYDSPEVNAFATGPTRNSSLVAVSTGLLSRMNQDQIEGVLGHEISHVANGDMVTMTLLQGVVNAFVMFLARVLAYFVAQAMRSGDREERGGGMNMMVYMVCQFVFEILLMFVGMIIVRKFSRWREFRADAGGARLAGRENMINALRGLQRLYGTLEENAGSHQQEAAIAAFKISGKKSGFMSLFATHPDLSERIARLEGMITV